uniref:Cullin-associated NEDD8-dissociated protein 1 n=1 Tax=Phallusia mammillata TaxID=59560 RepID=A0A6F9D8U6_9ASCI|nr:cullin-associated NEDD8-dissociated protein 1 [Phallusia mammillata]
MANASYHISSLLDKMNSHDKDYRFMATNDLMTELQKDSIKLDDESERKVIKMLLKLLEDQNGEVQNLAVRCLGPLVSKVKEHQIETIVETLCNNMISDKEQLRDISSIGLKTVIIELPQANVGLVGNICRKITGRLTSAIAKQKDVSVQLEALDILGDLLSRHGALLANFHQQIKDALLPLLNSSRMAVRKRVNTAIGHLVISCNNSVFMELINHLVSELKSNDHGCGDDNSLVRTRRTCVQCICAITRQAGHRVGRSLEQLMPLVTEFCTQDEADDELREHCLQAFELFVRRCPMEVTPHLSSIIEMCLNYITFDPNYNYDDGDDDDDTMEDDGDLDDQDDDEDYSDDEDMSWKVRRASAKCIEAIVSTRPELLVEFYQTVSLPLIARFKEREESVKADIFNAFIALVKHTKIVTSSSASSVAAGNSDAMEMEDTSLSLLMSQVPNIVKCIHKHLAEKSIKTRHCCFSLLTQLILTIPGCLSSHLEALMPGIEFSLSGNRNNSSNMKIDTLNFIHILLTNHEPETIHPFVQSLAPHVVACVKDPFYKITSDALLVMQDLVKIICVDAVKFDPDPLIQTLYHATLHRLKTSDIDQEVKERAITCMGQIMSSAGHRLTAEVPNTLQLFLDRLRNEITRLTAVKSLDAMAQSGRVSLVSILGQAMPVLANFLRKNQRSLKISTLKCLDSIFNNFSSDITSDMMKSVMDEIPQLISDSDLHITQLAMQLTSLMIQQPIAVGIKGLLNDILPNVYFIVRSPLLQGGALSAVLHFFHVLVTTSDARRKQGDDSAVSFRDVLRSLIEPIYPQRSTKQKVSSPQGSTSTTTTLHKQAFHSTAKCIATLVVACPSECEMIVKQFMMDVGNQKSTESIRTFVLLALGEIGQNVDLSSYKDLDSVVMSAFSASNEEVKFAASFSLGRICIGNLRHYLPGMLKQIHQQSKMQYLLLHSLKETITFSPPTALESYMGNIWDLLFRFSESAEEGTRNVVAECLGKLTLIHPERLLPKLRSFLSSDSALVRSTVVTAVKFTIADQPLSIDPLLRDCFGDFLSLLEDSDINVRRVTLTLLNSAAHNKSMLIRDLLPVVLPKLYSETKIRKELIREVMMGPFRHTVDDGLDVRKAAFECMYTLLESSVTQLDIFEFLNYVECGLKDSYDIKMLTFLMLVRLSHLCPTAVLQHVDKLVEPLRATCTVKVKADSVKQEFEKQDELKRSALRAVHALLAIPEADKSPAMSEFLAQVRSSTDLSAMFENIQKDSSSSTSLVAMETMDTS